MASYRTLFDRDEEREFDEERERRKYDDIGDDRRCTPERLQLFIERHIDTVGRFPTLGEIKREYGGILSAYVAAWELMDSGMWNKLVGRLRR